MLKYFKKQKQCNVIIHTNVTTTQPPIKPSFQEWVKEFNVSRLWDKKTVCME